MTDDNNIDPLKPLPPMTAGQKKFLAVLGSALVLMLAAGTWHLYGIGAFNSRPSYDETWTYCEPDDKCIAIPAPCESWIAVSDKHLDEARAYYDRMIALVEDSPQMECASIPQGDIQPKAYCLSGLCITMQ
jgi:hypothetical protein